MSIQNPSDSLLLPYNSSEIPFHPPRPDAEMRFYSVTVGVKPGVYAGTEDWSSQVNNVPGGAVRSFDSKNEAEEAYLQALAQHLVVQVQIQGERRKLTFEDASQIPGLQVSGSPYGGKWYALTVGIEPGLYPTTQNITPLTSNSTCIGCSKSPTSEDSEPQQAMDFVHNSDNLIEPFKKRPVVGVDGLTKHQRYYRRNAERLKRENAERQRQTKQHVQQPGFALDQGVTLAQDCHSHQDQAVQTNQKQYTPHIQDILDHLEGLITTYTKSALVHLYQDLGKLENEPTRRLLELRQRISSWSSVQGGYLMWNETTELQVKAAACKDSDALDELFGRLLLRKVAGQDLLCQLLDFGINDMLQQESETLVVVRSRLHLLSVVSFGLGITEVWLLVVQRRIQERSSVPTDEDLVADQLYETD